MRLILDPARQTSHQHVVVDPIEEVLQVHVHHPAMTRRDVGPRPQHGLMSAPLRPKAEALFREGRVEVGLQDLQERLLDQTVQDRRNPQAPHPAARLRDLHRAHQRGTVPPRQQLLTNGFPASHQVRAELFGAHAVDARGAPVALDSLVGPQQVLPAQHLLHHHRRPLGGDLVPCRDRLRRRRGFGSVPPTLLRVLLWLLVHGFSRSLGPRRVRSTSACLVRPFAGARRRLLRPRLTAGDPSVRLAATPSPTADRQLSQGKTRDLRPIHPSHLRRLGPDDFGLRVLWPSRPPTAAPLCVSCSSGRGFACSFLQIPPRGGHPCCSASGSRHQGPQGTFTPRSLPDSVSLLG